MGIDLAKMRQKHAALNNRGGDSSDNFWKPDEGTHQVRLVCPPDGDPFFEAYYHYGMGAEGKTTVLSPRTNGDADPIAEWGTRLWNEGTDGSKEAAKRFWPKMRIFAPIVVRGEEDKGIRAWGYGVTAYKKLLGLVLNPEYGDITDVDEGTDLTITYGKVAGKRFPETNINPRRRTSILCNDAVGGPQRCAELLNNMPDVSKLFERVSSQDAQNILDEVLADENTGAEEIHYNNTGATDDIEAAYSQLMNS